MHPAVPVPSLGSWPAGWAGFTGDHGREECEESERQLEVRVGAEGPVWMSRDPRVPQQSLRLQASTFDGEGDLRKSGTPRHGVSHPPGVRDAEEAVEELWAELLPPINKRNLPMHRHQPPTPHVAAVPPLPPGCCSGSAGHAALA